jgi:hypothetical protein
MFSGCASTRAVSYRITFDSSIDDLFIQSAWMAYSSHIANDMANFHRRNPTEDYFIPYNVEVDARNSLVNFYLRVQNEYEIYDAYIEDLIKIRAFNMLNEYVFFSFNPGNWVNEYNFREDNFTEWMENNLPYHVPLTLAHVAKLEN